jgi:hypothetical protein
MDGEGFLSATSTSQEVKSEKYSRYPCALRSSGLEWKGFRVEMEKDGKITPKGKRKRLDVLDGERTLALFREGPLFAFALPYTNWTPLFTFRLVIYYHPLVSTTIDTWLILPVVICLSQRLSHACLSINDFIL